MRTLRPTLPLAPLALLATAFLAPGCATTNSKFTFSDRASKVMFDPREIPEGQLKLVQDALLQGDRFVLIERTDSKSEQESLDKMAAGDKKARWKLWASRYEIGGVVVARSQCFTKKGFLSGTKLTCHQYLAIMHAQTGAAIAQAEGQNSEAADAGHPPDWEDVAKRLEESFDQAKGSVTYKPDEPVHVVEAEPTPPPSPVATPASAPVAAPAAATTPAATASKPQAAEAPPAAGGDVPAKN